MASCSQVCRELYNVIGETVVSGFLQEFGGRHPRRMMRNVLFRMYEKARVRSMSNLKGKGKSSCEVDEQSADWGVAGAGARGGEE